MGPFTLASGTKMPRMLYGTAWKELETERLVYTALKSGFRGIDTAGQPKHYREDLVGRGTTKFLAENIGTVSREDLYIQTKFTPLQGQDQQLMPYDPSADLPTQVSQSLQQSLVNLNVGYIDTFLLHSPLNTLEDTVIVWQAMNEIKNSPESCVRNIGISNASLQLVKALYQVTGIKPAVIQNRFYSHTMYDHELRAWADKEGVLYQSFWTITANPHLLRHPKILEISKDNKVSPELALYTVVLKEDICILNGTTNEQRMNEDLRFIENNPVGKGLFSKIVSGS
ncbi:putative aldo-keto reductase [Lipomyces arxii]|uniref:putative aldo-keto reductase n=1 Tax=Lipomyces arxii TaxID=56418 RepID=UPI0034CF5B67